MVVWQLQPSGQRHFRQITQLTENRETFDTYTLNQLFWEGVKEDEHKHGGKQCHRKGRTPING